jgi:hypothetical protein
VTDDDEDDDDDDDDNNDDDNDDDNFVTGLISVFRLDVAENCTLLGCYAASGGNFLPPVRANLPVSSTVFQNPFLVT